MRKSGSSVLSKSTFEESLDHLLKGALFNEEENLCDRKISSISGSILVGGYSRGNGTGKTELLPDLSSL